MPFMVVALWWHVYQYVARIVNEATKKQIRQTAGVGTNYTGFMKDI